jgi:hypothetical protein
MINDFNNLPLTFLSTSHLRAGRKGRSRLQALDKILTQGGFYVHQEQRQGSATLQGGDQCLRTPAKDVSGILEQRGSATALVFWKARGSAATSGTCKPTALNPGHAPAADRPANEENMRDDVLTHFRQLADTLATGERVNITITLQNGRELKAKLDPMFKTITIGGMTFPESELSTWTRLGWGSPAMGVSNG